MIDVINYLIELVSFGYVDFTSTDDIVYMLVGAFVLFVLFKLFKKVSDFIV
jgi:hypothetical protein